MYICTKLSTRIRGNRITVILFASSLDQMTSSGRCASWKNISVLFKPASSARASRLMELKHCPAKAMSRHQESHHPRSRQSRATGQWQERNGRCHLQTNTSRMEMLENNLLNVFESLLRPQSPNEMSDDYTPSFHHSKLFGLKWRSAYVKAVANIWTNI